MANIPPDILTHGNTLFDEYKGAFTENYVAQQLRLVSGQELYYWKSEGGMAKVESCRSAPLRSRV